MADASLKTLHPFLEQADTKVSSGGTVRSYSHDTGSGPVLLLLHGYPQSSYIIGSLGVFGGSMVGCQVLQGVQDGFCGCLTTVSTFVAEINGLRRRKGYFYGFTSVAVALGLTVVIMGSVRWSIGWGEVTCNTGYTTKIYG